MRQGTNNRRSRGRSGRKQQSGRFQTFDSNGPNGRLRGNAHQLYEKYLTLGRDAAGSGDRITAENLFQHAEHYFRIINANGGDGSQRPRINGEGEQPETTAENQGNGADGTPAGAEAGGKAKSDGGDSPVADDAAAAGRGAAATKGNGKGNGRQHRRKNADDGDSEPSDGDQTLVS